MPTINGENSWYKTSQKITVSYDSSLDGYEYAISTDGGTTYETYTKTTATTFTLNANSETIAIKVRGVKGSLYSNEVSKTGIKMDTTVPTKRFAIFWNIYIKPYCSMIT